jgi:DHA1 family bicyclomycin/chloramphenicol resistance-like MFS transporter
MKKLAIARRRSHASGAGHRRSALAWLAPGLAVLILARVVQAAGAGAASTVSRAAAADLFGGQDLTRVLAYTTMGMVVGPLTAPVVAGLLADRVGWTSIMLMLFVIGVIITMLAALGMPETRAATVPATGAPPANPLRDWRELLRNGRFNLYLSILVATQCGVYAFISASPYLVVEVLHRSATEYALFFIYITLGYLAGSYAAVRLARRAGTDHALLTGLLLFVASWGVMAAFVLSGYLSALTLFGPAAAMAMSNGLIQPNCHAAAMSLAGDRKGTGASLTGFTQIMAGAAGMQIMAVTHGGGSSPFAMIVVIGCAAVAGALLAAVVGRLIWLTPAREDVEVRA